MAKKTGVVRKGRSVVYGTKTKDRIEKKSFGPGDEIELDADEFERLAERGAVVLKGSEEAQVAKAAADTLPQGFPGLEALNKAGIQTYSALEAMDDLTEVKGIGESTAAEIEKALEARETE